MIPLVPGLKERLDEGIDAADVGAGAGHAINVLARAFTRSRFVGYDFSDEGLRLGAAEAQAWGLQNVRFEVRGGEGLGTCWGRQKALELLAEAGFTDVDVQTIEGDIEHYYYIARKRA